jgi:hypothetical protein
LIRGPSRVGAEAGRAIDGGSFRIRTRADTEQELTGRVRAEYAEMPGLSLTLSQAQRLWVIDRHTCESVCSALIAHGFLRMTTKGCFVRS